MNNYGAISIRKPMRQAFSAAQSFANRRDNRPKISAFRFWAIITLGGKSVSNQLPWCFNFFLLFNLCQTMTCPSGNAKSGVDLLCNLLTDQGGKTYIGSRWKTKVGLMRQIWLRWRRMQASAEQVKVLSPTTSDIWETFFFLSCRGH